MINWILGNKEWLFSGIGVALFGFVFYVWKVVSRRLPSPRTAGSSLSAAIQAPPPAPASLLENHGVVSLSSKEVIASIRQAPLLQQPDVAKHYRDVSVAWRGELRGATKVAEDLVRVYVACARSNVVVFFELKPSEHPGLALLRDGAPLAFEGQIEDANAEWISLRNVQVRSGLTHA
jgi:hypothetical protein